MPSYELTYTARGTLTLDAADKQQAATYGHEWLLHLLEDESPPPGDHPEVSVVDTLVRPRRGWSR